MKPKSSSRAGSLLVGCAVAFAILLLLLRLLVFAGGHGHRAPRGAVEAPAAPAQSRSAAGLASIAVPPPDRGKLA